MEDLKKSITELNGAVNAILDQLKNFHNRLGALEGSNGELGRSISLLEQKLAEKIFDFAQLSPAEEVRPTVIARAPMTEEELREIGRLPDCVKEIQVFEGNPSQYISWLNNVESILKDYETIKGKPLYRSIVQHIRQKIRGRADAALVSHNIFNNDWLEVKRVLSLHYADKRDIRTLEHQLNQLIQKGSKLDEFYATVNHQLSLIVNKIKTDEYSEETINVLIGTYRNRALDVFIRGLNPELSRMLIIQKPRSLPEAYSACLDIQNLTMRNTLIHANNFNKVVVPSNTMSASNQRPPIPPRTRFYNNWANKPFGSGHFRVNNNNMQWRAMENGVNNSENPVVKMEVDGTVQTRHANYMNRPRKWNADKRGPSSSAGGLPKQQKLFNLEASPEVAQCEEKLEQHDETEGNFLTEGLPAYFI